MVSHARSGVGIDAVGESGAYISSKPLRCWCWIYTEGDSGRPPSPPGKANIFNTLEYKAEQRTQIDTILIIYT